jgi:hypothetical protein
MVFFTVAFLPEGFFSRIEIVMFLPNPLVPPAWAEGKRDDLRDDLQCSI